MLHINDKKFFDQIVADAVAQAHLTCPNVKVRNQWIRAIAKGVTTLEGDTTFIHWDAENQSLLFLSPESNEIYTANGVCQCKAFNQENPKPCYHRAMSRLVKNYFEFQQKPNEIAKVDSADAVFFDEEMTAKQKVQLLNTAIAEGRVELKPRVEALRKHIN